MRKAFRDERAIAAAAGEPVWLPSDGNGLHEPGARPIANGQEDEEDEDDEGKGSSSQSDGALLRGATPPDSPAANGTRGDGVPGATVEAEPLPGEAQPGSAAELEEGAPADSGDGGAAPGEGDAIGGEEEEEGEPMVRASSPPVI